MDNQLPESIEQGVEQDMIEQDIEPKVGDQYYEGDGYRTMCIVSISGDLVEYIDFYDFGGDAIRRIGNYWSFVDGLCDGSIKRLK